MKYKFQFLIPFSLIFFLSWAGFGYLQGNQEPRLELKVTASKNSYLKGEIVSFTFQLKNQGTEDLTIANNFYIEKGYLHIYISQNGQDFKEYRSDAGANDSVRPPVQLRPNENIETSVTVFWNQRPKVSHLNAKAAKQFTDGKILTDYAFPESGTFYIKAVYTGLSIPGRKVEIVSEPIQIAIEEPVGEDLMVWNRIKDKSYIAFFIQESEFQTYEPAEKERRRQEVEQIFNQYRNSLIARQIGQSLEKFKVKEEKIKKIRGNLPQNQQ